MRLILLFLLVTSNLASLYCQNIDTLYVTKYKITKEKGNFEYYYIIKHDSANRFLYHVNLYLKSNSLKSKFTLQLKEAFANKSTLIKILEKDDYTVIGKELSYSDSGKLESESVYSENGKIEYSRSYLDNGDTVYMYTDVMPSFPAEFDVRKFLEKNCTMPEEVRQGKVSGKVIVRFVVDEKGGIEFPTVIKTLSPMCDAEAIRITRQIPNLIPGSLNGKNVKIFMALPIYFRR
jgi:Gram-negative bacterial TonB protein C-terminal